MRRAMIRKMPYSRFTLNWDKIVQLRDEEYSYQKYKRKRAYHNQSFKHHFLQNLDDYNYAIFNNNKNNIAYNDDIFNLLDTVKADIIYLDPPYNHRQYSWNYHILETIAKYDNPKIKGKTWMRDCSTQKSDYCKKQEVKNSFKELIQNIDAKYVFMSYNCEWLLSHQEIKEIMETRWKYWVFTKEYRRFKAGKDRNFKKDSVLEYLHYVEIN